jgi:hypothetical protein
LHFYIDQEILSVIFGVSCAICGFFIHKHWWANKHGDIVSTTVEYLCEQGFVRSTYDEDGELVLHQFNDQPNVKQIKNSVD